MQYEPPPRVYELVVGKGAANVRSCAIYRARGGAVGPHTHRTCPQPRDVINRAATPTLTRLIAYNQFMTLLGNSV